MSVTLLKIAPRSEKSAPHPPSFIHSFIIHHPSITIHHSFSHHPSIIHTTSTIHSLIDSFIMILSFNIHHPYIVRSSLITHTPFTTHRSPFLHSVIHTFENSAQKRPGAPRSKKSAPFRRQTCGTSTMCFNLRGVTTTREKQKKVHRFADKLVVPPQSA